MKVIITIQLLILTAVHFPNEVISEDLITKLKV